MKKLTAICIGLAFTVAAAIPAYAGMWRLDESGWWYMNDDGSYPAGCWQWIDSNGDGTAECYYFYPDGYMARNNDIDGYHVDDAGQWVIGDQVQKKTVSGAASTASGGASYGAYGAASVAASYGAYGADSGKAASTGASGAAASFGTSGASGRDMSYAQYCRGINSLWADATEYGLGYYDIALGVSPETMTDLGDCWKVNDVQVYLPYEYSTRSQAEAQLSQLIRTDSFEYGDGIGHISQNYNGTYSIRGMNDAVYSYQVWSGSVYIRKDALISYTNYDSDMRVVTEPFGTYYAREAQSQWFYSVSCVISAVDENGYITVLRLAQWG